MQSLDDILLQAKAAIQSATDLKLLDSLRVQYLGKKGQLTEHLKLISQLSESDRKTVGQKINKIKETIQTLIAKQQVVLEKTLIENQLLSESIDITLPGRSLGFGSIHPITQTIADLQDIFTQMGFVVMEGPEIEDDYHNFVALNIPSLHPARAISHILFC